MATSREENVLIIDNNHSNSLDSLNLGNWNTFNFKYSCCNFCSGFYGPCFGEPVCPTCHAFLFPDDINVPDGIVVVEEKMDDDDSGNDEPTDFFFHNNRSIENRPHHSCAKADGLAEKIKALSVPKEKVDVLSEDFLDLLPAEVLLIVFSYLDDISLWCCAQVCRRWHQLVYSETTQEQWKKFCCRRWPLYKPLSKIHAWKSLYTKLIHSTPCLLCLHQMTMQVSLPLEDTSWRKNRLKNELKALRSDPPDGIDTVPLDKQCSHWQASISGPVGSPYEGGRFFLYLQIPHSYPMRPPVVRFITKIFHPNVSCHGDVGIDSIQHNWSLALTISKVLISIQSLLTDPYCRICMEPKIGKLYAEDRLTFDRLARSWTRRYAMHDNILLNADFCKSLESG